MRFCEDVTQRPKQTHIHLIQLVHSFFIYFLFFSWFILVLNILSSIYRMRILVLVCGMLGWCESPLDLLLKHTGLISQRQVYKEDYKCACVCVRACAQRECVFGHIIGPYTFTV